MRTETAGAVLRVQVQIVTYNSVDAIGTCLDTVLQQTSPITRIVVIDNASSDRSLDLIEQRDTGAQVIRNPENLGYAAAHNIGFRLALSSGVDYVLTLNPDVKLTSTYVQLLLREMESQLEVGGITGKLLRTDVDPFGKPLIDSTGLVMQRFFHVRDRDAGTRDAGQRDTPETVWGVCGAAALYRVSMLEDLLQSDEVFDESFFVYKEDVDLCWRAKRRNWRFRYVPDAVALHQRSWIRGREMPGLVVAHSFANQIALLIRHVHGLAINLIVSVVVELVRYLGLVATRPRVALATVLLIRSSWSHHCLVRGQLRQTDTVKERTLYDIGNPSNL